MLRASARVNRSKTTHGKAVKGREQEKMMGQGGNGRAIGPKKLFALVLEQAKVGGNAHVALARVKLGQLVGCVVARNVSMRFNPDKFDSE